ncbi:MMPL family transporter [Nesterenkonia sp. E16_7]|uniref:MMPL family transporter n=1 Tax=unclassified Nesterenkonia TaxID=2629769 RepID=UPI001A91E6E2|nr:MULTISPECIES: MMPL family transporter [unclassified Nesterenkonia]MBO0595279.1 MMPL family transporter [Nesterenkonia sp. E16_10]MBO0598068.1 MMPL family transporter [Nesterenkonia sp. E16_7]
MAKLLYRLGLLSARRAKTVVAAWLAMLALAVSSFLAFGGQLTDQITLPDLETTAVADRLVEEMPDSGGGNASAILRTDDGEPFTAEQEEQVAEFIAELEGEDIVSSVTDPFVTEEQIAEARSEISTGESELESGREEIETNREELESGREEIESGLAQLDEGQEQLDQAIAEAREQGIYEAAQPQFEAQQAELDASRAELEAAQQELEAGEEELDAGAEELTEAAEELERGEALLELSSGAQVVSEDGDVAVLMLNFTEPMESIGTEDLATVSEVITDAQIDGVEALPGGDLDFELPHLFSVAELIGLMIAAAVLLIMLGTLIGAGLPLLNALIGVGVGVAGALAFSGVVDMMSMTPILGLMLGLAVGIDYSLFIIHRHRRQLKDGMAVHTSIALATGTAGNAVVFAGATVVIALLALNVTGLPFLALMGSVAAACVAIAVLMAVTMTPAMLSLVDRRILGRKERRHIGERRTKQITTPMGHGKAIGIAAAALIGLGVLSIPTFDLRLGLPDASSNAEDSASYQAYAATEEAFGQGVNGPLLVLADLPSGLEDAQAQDYQIEIGTALLQNENIAAAVPAALNDDNTLGVFQIIPEEGPAAESTENLVHEFREGNPLAGTEAADVELSVAGMTAAQIDMSDVISDALPLYLALVIGLSLLLMIMVFRSILLPVIATLGFVGSFAAAVGIVVAVFQWGWLSEIFGVTTPGPVLTFLPVLMVGILFGLAMDYQLFTASGMREAYAHGSAPRLAVRQGLHAGRSVVTAAALIMASVFAGFVFTDDPMIASMGLGLSVGVLLDAFVVRLMLVPALLHLAGPAAWWLPKWMDRLIPDVDVEGAQLEREVVPEAAGPADGLQPLGKAPETAPTR